jgi:hypothetical protein
MNQTSDCLLTSPTTVMYARDNAGGRTVPGAAPVPSGGGSSLFIDVLAGEARGGTGAKQVISGMPVTVFLVDRVCGKGCRAFRAACVFARSTPAPPIAQSRC